MPKRKLKVNNMESYNSEDLESFDDNSSNYSFSSSSDDSVLKENIKTNFKSTKCYNVVSNIMNRQIYGRFTKHSKAKTERLFNDIHPKCRFELGRLAVDLDHDPYHHVYMGFTMCGQYFISYFENISNDTDSEYGFCVEYELYIWRFSPGIKLKFVSKHRIFKHLRGAESVDKLMVLQFPMDMQKIIVYGQVAANPDLIYLSILTLPSPKNCKHCMGNTSQNDSVNQGWCSKHGFIVHYMVLTSLPTPSFDPKICLAFPNYLVLNTGHFIHILNIETSEPTISANLCTVKDIDEQKVLTGSVFNDSMSEMSESPSENFESNSVVDAIIEDFSEYDLESTDCNKPFHELNISCEPLNVTIKSYHNTLVQNIVDPRLKRLSSNKDYLFSIPQSTGVTKTLEKSKIDKNIAEKAYEFTEENEKCEKLSSFRKKRLAEKKYEFSEDNSENIVPFNSLRRERRVLNRTQARCIRSPDFSSLFLGPRPSMQSPNARSNAQFSPGRGLYNPSIRNSPHHSKSPISPKESARKFSVYSPSLDSDCSDYESRLIMRTCGSTTTTTSNINGLLILAPKDGRSKWIKKIVRRFSNGDFETSSLLSGQSRDDYNNPIEIPLLVQNLTEQHLDMVPDFKIDHVTEMQLIVTQKSFDCEHFVQRRSQLLCSEAHLQFLHCEDYDIKIIQVCPASGDIFCNAVIKIGALQRLKRCGKPDMFIAHFLFTWNILTDAFDVIESKEKKLVPFTEFTNVDIDVPEISCNEVLVMDLKWKKSKTSLRDYNNLYEIRLPVQH